MLVCRRAAAAIRRMRFYENACDNLKEYYLHELPKQQQEMERWENQIIQNENEVLVESRKFCQALVAKVGAIDCQFRQEALIEALVQHFKLKFVTKDTTITNNSPAEKVVLFVALGSVGLYAYSAR